MTERLFRLVIGTCILTALYFDSRNLIIGLIAVLTFEGLSNLRIPLLVSRLRYGASAVPGGDTMLWPIRALFSFGFDAERVWRFAVAIVLALAYLMYYQQAWFIPWFMGFAIFGAGLSGVCPMLLSLKLVGFK